MQLFGWEEEDTADFENHLYFLYFYFIIIIFFN